MGEITHFDIHKPKIEEKGFRQIKPQEGMTPEKSRIFWNNLFSRKLTSDFAEIENCEEIQAHSAGKSLKEPENAYDEKDKPEVTEDITLGDNVENQEVNDSADEIDETKKLTEEEINEQQKKEIEEAAKRIARGEKLTDAEKGNLGEMLMDQYYISQGYKPIHEPRVTSLEHKSGKGIDGVYEKTNPDGTKSYVIGEAKVNSSRLNKGLADGTDQMSDQWVENRLDQAVGKEKADEIRDAYEDNPESVSKEVYHFSYSEDGSGKADVSTVDDSGNQNKSEVVQIFDKNGNEVQGGVQNDQR